MKTELNTDWKTWIKINVENGQDKNRLFKILLDEGFAYESIREEMQFEPTTKTEFSAAWKDWIKTNVDDGQDKNGLFKILLDEGFAYESIHQQMQFEPSLPINELVNPLKAKEQQQEQNSLPAVDMNQLFIPDGQPVDSDALHAFTVENFLNLSECKAVASEIKQTLSATVPNNAETAHSFHQGGACDLGSSNNSLIEEIDLRLCKLIA